MTYGLVAFVLLVFAWSAWNSFVARRYKNRFAKAVLEEFKHAYPDSASQLPPELGPQIAHILVSNKKLANEINALERQVSKRPDIKSKSYTHFDSDYSPETQELITDLLKNKLELAGKIFNSLPSKVKSQIDRKAESLDNAAAETELSDEGQKDRKKDEERAKRFGLKAWRFNILMNIYDIAGRANLASI